MDDGERDGGLMDGWMDRDGWVVGWMKREG